MGEVSIEVETVSMPAEDAWIHSSSLSLSPSKTSRTVSLTTPSFITPFDSPTSMQGYLEEVGHIYKPEQSPEAWLPITESRNGNAYFAAFHTLSSGVGIQALLLPVAFVTLGWIWGIICLTLAFVWQLYTHWLLIQLHESVPGTRHSRYLKLSVAVFDDILALKDCKQGSRILYNGMVTSILAAPFKGSHVSTNNTEYRTLIQGEKLGKMATLFPIMYLSGGTCVTFIIIAGNTMKLLFQSVFEATSIEKPLTTIEWFLVFTCIAIILAQLPNLNSVAGVSIIGSVTVLACCTLIWATTVNKGRAPGVSYDSLNTKPEIAKPFYVFNALGLIAFAFRGHNVVLEIQGTMPSSVKYPSRVPMWRGVKFAYFLKVMCLFPLAISGYWAYGNSIPANGGILGALPEFHSHNSSRLVMGLSCILVLLSCLCSFQIYAMPVFDNLEFVYISRRNKRCPPLLRLGIRVFFGCLTFFIAVTFPFLPFLAGLIGGIALPVSLAYPCFMWIMIKKPQRYSLTWCFNWGLGTLGMILSMLVIAGAVWNIAYKGMRFNFFKP